MNNYAIYIKEQFGDELIEHEHGFITYKIADGSIFIKEFFVHPDHRTKGIGRVLIDSAIRAGLDSGCERAFSMITQNAFNWESSLSANLYYGFKEECRDDNKIYLVKEL